MEGVALQQEADLGAIVELWSDVVQRSPPSLQERPTLTLFRRPHVSDEVCASNQLTNRNCLGIPEDIHKSFFQGTATWTPFLWLSRSNQVQPISEKTLRPVSLASAHTMSPLNCQDRYPQVTPRHSWVKAHTSPSPDDAVRVPPKLSTKMRHARGVEIAPRPDKKAARKCSEISFESEQQMEGFRG